jgi:dTDP-4-dehydrorhamnose 3,5-epimerase
MLWVPPGFAHGFLVTSPTADFQYKCTDFYAPEWERSIHWCDPILRIDWRAPKASDLHISLKDNNGMSFSEARLELLRVSAKHY